LMVKTFLALLSDLV